MLQVLCLSIFPGAMVLTALMDLFTMTIPNRISLVLVAGFFALAPFVGLGAETILWHIATGASMLVLSFAMFWRGWIGGGDAKIFSAIALWIGAAQLGQFVGYAAIAGGLLTIVLLTFRRLPLPSVLASTTWVSRLHAQNAGVPYGIALALAALMIYPSTPWLALG